MDQVKYGLSPKEAGEYLGIGENRMRELIARGEIPAARVGKNYKLSKPLIERWFDEKCLKGERI